MNLGGKVNAPLSHCSSVVLALGLLSSCVCVMASGGDAVVCKLYEASYALTLLFKAKGLCIIMGTVQFCDFCTTIKSSNDFLSAAPSLCSASVSVSRIVFW